jgi:hypothetical protein
MRWWILVAYICEVLGWYCLITDREQNKPYLYRYYIFSTRWLARWFPKLSYRMVLHKCVLSDADGLHDHPWAWKSKILEGGYWENIPGDRKRWRGPDGWRSRTANDYHRLELPYEGAVSWSLFIMGPKEKDWGFQDRDGNWVQWKEYIDNRHLYI